jgi:hypothetical protein
MLSPNTEHRRLARERAGRHLSAGGLPGKVRGGIDHCDSTAPRAGRAGAATAQLG